MGRAIVNSLRVFQVFLAVANIALSAYVVNWFNEGSRIASPSPYNFFIFAPVFSIFSIIYLEATPRYAPRASHPIAALAVELTNSIFYFAGFIALTIFLSHLVFCHGTVCTTGRADAVVAAAQFASWIATSILQAIEMFTGGSRKPTSAGAEMREV
ncbi:Fc.00g007630.m01.CDS01 [Cosmosporella sp. VM-42]